MSEVFNFHSTKNTLDDGRTFYIRLLLWRPHLFNVFTYKDNESERTKTVSSFFRNNLVSAYMITHVVQWCFTYKNDLHCIQSINGYFMFLIPLWHQTVWAKVKWLRFYPSLSSDSRGACERSYRDPSRSSYSSGSQIRSWHPQRSRTRSQEYHKTLLQVTKLHCIISKCENLNYNSSLRGTIWSQPRLKYGLIFTYCLHIHQIRLSNKWRMFPLNSFLSLPLDFNSLST